MKQARQQELLSRLSLVQKVSLSEAMELLGISESTARRLFVRLEQEGYAIRTHGGLQRVNNPMTLYSFEQVAKTNIRQKTAIAREACRYIENGDVIFCDSGTTIQCFCAELVSRLRTQKLELRLYTNSLANLELLSPYVQVNLVGGEYRANRKDFCGYMSEHALSDLHFTKCFVGADGCADGRKFTTTDFDTAKMNQIAIQNSDKAFMLADSSKFTVASHVAYVTTDLLHTVITDTGIDPATAQRIREAGLELICVDAGPETGTLAEET